MGVLKMKKYKTIDPHNQKRRWNNRRYDNFEGLFNEDVTLIKEYLTDMKEGNNVFSKKKGSRSYARLNALKSRIPKIAKWFKDEYKKRLTELNIRETTTLFNKLINGEIKKDDDTPYKSADDFVKDFKAFWNWYMRKKRREYNYMLEKEKKKVSKEDYLIPDITEDIPDNNNKKPKWIYFEPDYQKLRDKANYDYKVIMDLLMDSGIRFPSELVNLRVSDFKPLKNNKADLRVREETNKTEEGRTIKLMFSYPIVKDFINENKLKDDDLIFTKNTNVMNRYFRRLGYKVLGIGKKYFRKSGKSKTTPDVKEGITGYDFRHNSACYWLPRYPTQSGMMYRFGWKTTKMIEYYTEFLGMKDNISDDDLLIGSSKTELEKKTEKLEQENEILKESLNSVSKDMELIKSFMDNPEIKKVIGKI